MRAMGVTAAFMGPDAIVDTTLIDVAGLAAEGTYATFVGAPPDQLTNTAGQKFYNDFKQKYNEEPEAFAALGYDAARVLIEAMNQPGRIDRASVLAGVSAAQLYNGTAGQFEFDRNGDTTITLVSGNIVQGGVFKFAKVLTGRQ
jgi:branched-chain amino acid transport system substrate-binding protein